MSVALELRRAAVAAGDRASFVPTGQTGMMIEGWGVAVDRLISDFAQGTVEWLVEEGEALGDWVIVEGQGSLDHPAYSSVTLALIHGATPHAMVMVHKPGLREHDFDHLPEASFPIASLPGFIDLHERDRRARRAVEGRRGRPQHLALPGRRRGARRSSRRPPPRPGCRPTTRSASGRTGCGPPSAGRGGRAAVGRPRMSLHLTHEILHLAPARPVPDRPRRPRHAPTARHDRRRRAARRPVPGHRRARGGLPGPVLRRDARDDGGRLPAAARRRRRGRARRGRARTPRTSRWRRPSAGTAPPAARSTSRSTTWSAR